MTSPGQQAHIDAVVPAEGDPESWMHGWRRLSLSAGMLSYPVVTATGVEQFSSGAIAIVGYVLVVVFAVCYLVAAVAVYRMAWRRFWVMVAVMTAAFVGTLPSAQAFAFFLCAALVSIITEVIKQRAVPIVVVSALAALFVPLAIPSWHSGPGWIQAVMIVFTVAMVYVFSELVRSNRALVDARAEVAKVASEAERARIARDLHDLLGHSLTAITVKSSLACRLASHEHERSVAEMAEVEKLARQALADVRAAVSGYRDVTLANELARGRELLRASGVTADLPTATDVVDVAHQELFGWAVREGLTNVARHARATQCTVTLSASEVEVRDDGVGGITLIEGSGLAGLRERVAMAGGAVEAGPVSPRGWRLRVYFDQQTAAMS